MQVWVQSCRFGSGRYPGIRNGNALQYSSLENSMDRKAWWATVHGVAKHQTKLSARVRTHTHLPILEISYIGIIQYEFSCD